MNKLILILVASLAAPAYAEFYPSNLVYRILAGAAALVGETYYWHRSNESAPIFRPSRVRLQDVRPCPQGESCVLLNGRKVELEATPASLMHGRLQVVGKHTEKTATTIYAKLRFGAWVSSEPDYFHIWATIRHPGHQVKVTGYAIQRDEEPGVENEALSALSDLSLYTFLTSTNPVEIEVARELVGRRVFCTRYPEQPINSIRDDVAPLETHGLIGNDEAQSRLSELNAIAAVIDLEHGRRKCESPITDQLDIVLDQARVALQKFVDEAAKPPKTQKAAAPKVEVPAPSPAPPIQGIPFLTPPRPAT